MTGPARTPQSSRKALAEAYEQAVKAEQDKRSRAAQAEKRSRTRLVMLSLGWVVALGGIGLLVARPDLFGLERHVETTVERDANLRLSLYMAGRQLEAYRKAYGTYPNSLAEAGKTVPGIEYQRTKDGGYEMRLSRGGQIVLLTSKDSLSAFIGPSLGRVMPGKK